jgi:hypothetical protein
VYLTLSIVGCLAWKLLTHVAAFSVNFCDGIIESGAGKGCWQDGCTTKVEDGLLR